MRDLFPPRPATKHFNAVDFRVLPELMSKLRATPDPSAATVALEFTILTAARTGEVLGARWSEIDFHEAVWTIPGTRMKRGRQHLVPLSDRAIEILRGMHTDVTRADDLIFGGAPASMLVALQAIEPGATVHGMRSSFKDWARERTDFSDEVSEHALAHGIPDRTRASYRRYTSLDARRIMLRQWSEFLSCTTVSNTPSLYLRSA